MVSIICWIKHVIESRPYLKIYLLPIDCTHWLRVVWWLGDGWDWGWCGRCDGWSKEQKIRICQGKIKKQQVKQVNKAIPHPHIASTPRHLSIKDAPGIGCGEAGRWTVTASPQGRRDVGANAIAMVSDFLFIKRSFDICLPCCFCTLLSRAQPRCVCK
jgi:hypothetical protein